jgi:hypothetical protein
MHAAAWWRSRCGFTGGLGIVRPVGTPWGSDGGWVGQGGAVGFSPEMAGGGGAKKMTQRGDRAPVDGEGVDKSYSWRRGQGRWGTVQKGWMTGAWWSSPRGGQNNGVAARRWRDSGSPVGQRGHEAEEREKGVMECSSARSRGRMRGERKWGARRRQGTL